MSVPRSFIPAVQLLTRPRDKPSNATTAAIPTEIPNKVRLVRTGRRVRLRVTTLKNVISLVQRNVGGVAIKDNASILHLQRKRGRGRDMELVCDENGRHVPLAVERA